MFRKPKIAMLLTMALAGAAFSPAPAKAFEPIVVPYVPMPPPLTPLPRPAPLPMPIPSQLIQRPFGNSGVRALFAVDGTDGGCVPPNGSGKIILPPPPPPPPVII